MQIDYKIQLQHLVANTCLINTPIDSRAFIASKIIANKNNGNDYLFITANDVEMTEIASQLQFFGINTIKFPAFDNLPYDRCSPKAQILATRIKALFTLQQPSKSSRVLLASVNAVLQKTITSKQLANIGISVVKGSIMSIPKMAELLVNLGYTRQATANEVGEFAVRGGIVDIVLQQAADIIGYRLDFFGQEVESIKIFDPITQLSSDNVKMLEILPTSELFLQSENIQNFRGKYRSLFGYHANDALYEAISEGRKYPGSENWLPLFYQHDLQSIFHHLQQPLVFITSDLTKMVEHRLATIDEYYQNRLQHQGDNALSPHYFYLSGDEFWQLLYSQNIIEFASGSNGNNPNFTTIDLNIRSIPDFTATARINKQDPLLLLQQYLQAHKQTKILGYLYANMQERLPKLLHDYQINSQEITNFQQEISPHKIAITKLPLQLGFSCSDYLFIGEQAIFGEKSRYTQNNKNSSQRLVEEGLAIACGELVVHRDYGIGKFVGIEQLSVLNKRIDMLKIVYANNDSLFVPVTDLELIYRYGADNAIIELDKLGGNTNWKNRCQKAKDKIKLAAEELLKIAAARKLAKAPVLIADQHLYQDFVARFGFAETTDQLKAIAEVEQDLQKGIPMDRLICGDVGFGKTEVALRATAIACLQQNKVQVAIVAPTTILARQHYRNFSKRFAHSNIKIALLSRLISNAEATKTKHRLAIGEIDIIIGTHALLQDSIKFANLGLLIIDEEQHFGVAQKEKLKKMRSEVHILTLSATPIPRTLHMSLSGVKDLSLIATPPADRLAVRNFTMPYDAVIAREAIMREYNRSGQVFFVVPRLSDINELSPRLIAMLPELKIAVAHGQMPATKLEQIMNDFLDGKIDVLLSTTIIESGIDIGNANTMIIYKAEHFGLSQLYQLRGRVGRGKIRGYCYFMLDNRKKISSDSLKKLEVMQKLDALGVGFNIASCDLDIRGSGNLLGSEQSGHVNEVGAEFYQQLIIEATNNLQPSYNVAVKIPVELFIPETYMPDLSLRMSFYKKISFVKTTQDYDRLYNEMSNRFGAVPQSVIDLLEVAMLKESCKQLNIDSIEITKQGVLLSFYNNQFAGGEKLLTLAMQQKIKILAQQKVLFFNENLAVNHYTLIKQTLQQLQNCL